MNLKYEVGQTVKVEANKTVVELMESEIKSITVCSTGAKYLTSKGAFSEEQLDAFALKAQPTQPIAPQEDKAKENDTLYCIKSDYGWCKFEKGNTYECNDLCIREGTCSTTYTKNSDWFKSHFVKLVKRPAKVGEWVLLTNVLCASNYGNGEIYKVSEISVGKPVISGKTWGTVLLQSEYLVLDNYQPEPEKEPEPVYYSGKVVCVKTDGDGTFTVGKVYEFVDGRVLDNESCKRPTGMKIKSLGEAYMTNWYYSFIPYLGEV